MARIMRSRVDNKRVVKRRWYEKKKESEITIPGEAERNGKSENSK